jgi:hypothetical protein
MAKKVRKSKVLKKVKKYEPPRMEILEDIKFKSPQRKLEYLEYPPLPPITIANIVYDPPGLDRVNYVWVNLDQEIVEIRNVSAYDVDLSQWELSDRANHRYLFPDGFVLQAGSAVKVHTGKGVDSGTDLYMNRGAPIWNNEGDTAVLRDRKRRVVAQYSY